MADKLAEKPPVKPEKPVPLSSEERFSEITEVKDPVPAATRGQAFMNGLLGAFLGSLPGMTVWIILGKFGIRAMILGFFLAAGTVWGYGRMTRKTPLWKGWGIIICTFIMIFSVYLAQKITWTWGITEAFKDTTEYLNQQVMAVQSEDADVSEESVRQSIEALNKRTFGFSKGTFANCYTHFYSLLDFLDLKKDFISALVQSYISAALGAASLLKNKVRTTVGKELSSADKPKEEKPEKKVKEIKL